MSLGDRVPQGGWLIGALIAISGLTGIVFWITIVYVAHHFIAKYW